MRVPRAAETVLPAAATFLAAAALVLFGVSLGAAQEPSPEATGVVGEAPAEIDRETLSADERTGLRLYLRDCAWCHGNAGQGTDTGPSLIGVGAASADFMLRTGRMPIPEVQQQPRRAEPQYAEGEIAAMAAFVASLGEGPPIPDVDPSAGDLGEGEELYRANCAACHSSTGVGAALTSGLIAPGVLDATAVEIAEATRLGGAGLRSGNMPRFGEDTMTDEELNSVTRYVLYLQQADHPGGASLFRVGPVAEGLVAWGVGLLVLVVLVRWIGTRAGGKGER